RDKQLDYHIKTAKGTMLAIVRAGHRCAKYGMNALTFLCTRWVNTGGLKRRPSLGRSVWSGKFRAKGESYEKNDFISVDSWYQYCCGAFHRGENHGRYVGCRRSTDPCTNRTWSTKPMEPRTYIYQYTIRPSGIPNLSRNR